MFLMNSNHEKKYSHSYSRVRNARPIHVSMVLIDDTYELKLLINTHASRPLILTHASKMLSLTHVVLLLLYAQMRSQDLVRPQTAHDLIHRVFFSLSLSRFSLPFSLDFFVVAIFLFYFIRYSVFFVLFLFFVFCVYAVLLFLHLFLSSVLFSIFPPIFLKSLFSFLALPLPLFLSFFFSSPASSSAFFAFLLLLLFLLFFLTFSHSPLRLPISSTY